MGQAISNGNGDPLSQFVTGLRKESIDGEYLASSLAQMVSSREAFVAEARNLVIWATTVIGASGAAVSWGATQPGDRLLACLITAAVMLGLVAFLLWFAGLDKLEFAYNFYVGMCIHAAVIHRAAGIRRTHPWFSDVESHASATGAFWPSPDGSPGGTRFRFFAGAKNKTGEFEPVDSVQKIAIVWTSERRTLEHTYRRILIGLIAVSVAASIACLGIAVRQ